MARGKVTLAFAGLYLLIWPVWAKVEVSMQDRVEVYLGSAAQIPCIYNLSEPSNATTLQWFVTSASTNYNRVRIYYKDGSGAIEDQGTGFSGRINVSHSQDASERNTVLTVSGVMVSDEQEFICQVTVDGESQEGKTRLLVFNAPSPPSVEVGSYASTVSVEPEQIASCDVTNGYPAPQITWYKDRSPLAEIDDVVKLEKSVTTNPSGLFTVRSELYLKVEKEDKDVDFYCEVTYPVPAAQKMMESDRIRINVYYPTTTVTVSQETPAGLVKEGDRVEIKCQGDGNPQPIKTFMFNNETKSSETGLLVLESVTRLNTGLYECSALDIEAYEESIGRLDLMVHYLDPVVITPDKPQSLEQGQNLSLTCNALSSLPTRTRWHKDDLLLTEDHMLTLNDVSFEAAGSYVCEVVAPELGNLSKQNAVHVNVRGKPMLTDGVTLIRGNAEQYINVSCRAKGFPIPTIQWNLTDEQEPLHEWNTSTENSVVSIISLTAASDVTVSCTATNELGTVAESIHIKSTEMKETTTTTAATVTTKALSASTVTPQRKTKKEGNGVIIAVIIIFILLLAILGSVLYFLYKKGRISCGRSAKQDLTKEKASSDDIVVEMKSSKSEEAVLLQRVNGEKKISGNQ